MLVLIATIFPLLASMELKTEVVIAHKKTQNEQDIVVEENLHGGRVLVLSDGSMWAIAPQSLKHTEYLFISGPIKIKASNNPSFPYLLTITSSNKDENKPILARRISSSSSPS